jgi:uncharacterized membrane protein
MIAFGVGVVVALATTALDPRAHLATRAIAAWDGLCLTYLGLVWRAIAGTTLHDIRARAEREDEGRGLILGLVLAASAASLVAMGFELSIAKHATGFSRAAHVAAAAGSVGLSWLMVQVIFALHYAHEYYTAHPESGVDCGGLMFPGGEPPDYWDFLHFAIVIGVAAQTADIAFERKDLRRLGTVHAVLAFGFNTVVVALTINLMAGLF